MAGEGAVLTAVHADATSVYATIRKLSAAGVVGDYWNPVSGAFDAAPAANAERIALAQQATGLWLAVVDQLETYDGRLLVQFFDNADALFAAAADVWAANGIEIGLDVDLAGISSAGATDQTPIPPGRTVLVVAKQDLGLVGERTLRDFQTGDNKLIAIDFREDLPFNGRLVSIASAAIQTGTAGGLTLTPIGIDRTLAKIRVVANTAGTYVVRVGVTYEQSQTAEADITIIVVAA